MNRFEILFLSQKLTPQAIARNVSLQEVREVFQNILDHPHENKERYAAIKRMSSTLRAGLYDQYLSRLDATKALLSTLSISASKREKYRRQCDKFFRKIENIGDVECIVYMMVDIGNNAGSPLWDVLEPSERVEWQDICILLSCLVKKSPIHYWIEEFVQFERLIQESAQKSRKKHSSQKSEVQIDQAPELVSSRDVSDQGMQNEEEGIEGNGAYELGGVSSEDVLYRLGRMQTRVKNILDGQVRIGHIDELQRMMERLNEILQTFDMHTMNPRILMTAHPIKQEIQTLLEIGVDEDEGEEEYISHLEYEEGVHKPNHTYTVPSEEAQECLQFIQRWRTQVLTYDDSSQKGGESIGDGNFIFAVWRPFLAHVQHLVVSNMIHVQSFSWHEVARYVSQHDGIQRKKRLSAFLYTLQGYQEDTSWQENCVLLVEAIKVYRMNRVVCTHEPSAGIVPLNNVITKLEESLEALQAVSGDVQDVEEYMN